MPTHRPKEEHNHQDRGPTAGPSGVSEEAGHRHTPALDRAEPRPPLSPLPPPPLREALALPPSPGPLHGIPPPSPLAPAATATSPAAAPHPIGTTRVTGSHNTLCPTDGVLTVHTATRGCWDRDEVGDGSGDGIVREFHGDGGWGSNLLVTSD